MARLASPRAIDLLSPPTRFAAAVLLLALGVEIWLVLSSIYGPPEQLKATFAALVLASVPPVNGLLRRALDAVDRHVAIHPRTWATCAGLAAILYLYRIAVWQGRPLVPQIHDEWQFLLQARFLANGKLWLPSHTLADFFDTFYVLRTPVYAPQSFPGWPLMIVPATWLGLPHWTTPLVVTGLVVGVTFRLVAQHASGTLAVLSTLLLCSLWLTRVNAFIAMSHTPAMLLGVLTIATFWRWADADARARRRWAITIGFVAGWAAITRPIDALCYAMPIGVIMAIDFARRAIAARDGVGRRAVCRSLAATAALVSAGAVPMLALQLVFDVGVTGHVFETPFHLYNEIDQPGHNFLGAGDASRRPQTTLPQKIAHYDGMVTRALAQFHGRSFGRRLADVASAVAGDVFSQPLLFVLLPAALLTVGRSRLWLLLAPVPLYVLGYAWYPIGGAHYATVVVVPCATAVLLGIEGLSSAFGSAGRAALVPAVATLVVISSPPFDRLVYDELTFGGDIAAIQRTLATVPPRSIVLFVPNVERSLSEEPVYNLGVASPDDATVIRAHDLGPRNAELFAYYGARQPDRIVYRYDRTTDAIERLGNVAELATRCTRNPPATTRPPSTRKAE